MKSVLKEKCTINFWAYEDNLDSRSVFFGGFSGSNFNIEQQGTNFRVYWAGSPDIQINIMEAKKWAMYTVTIDVATGIKIYKNGEEVYLLNVIVGFHTVVLCIFCEDTNFCVLCLS